MKQADDAESDLLRLKYLAVECAIVLCALTTSLCTAAAVVYIEHKLNVSIYSYMLWFIITAGAIGTGIIGSSGYFSALLFHKRPTLWVMLGAFFVAGGTQLAIYYFEYVTFQVKDNLMASDVISFQGFLNIVLTKASYRVGRYGIGSDTGELGNFGYILAVIQFVGSLSGAMVVIGYLRQSPFCKACRKYMRVWGRQLKTYDNAEKFSPYYDNLFLVPVDSPEFVAAVEFKDITLANKIGKGAVHLTETLMGCNECGDQLFEQKVQIYNGRDWNEVTKLKRRVSIPYYVKLVDAFAKQSKSPPPIYPQQPSIS